MRFVVGMFTFRTTHPERIKAIIVCIKFWVSSFLREDESFILQVPKDHKDFAKTLSEQLFDLNDRIEYRYVDILDTSPGNQRQVLNKYIYEKYKNCIAIITDDRRMLEDARKKKGDVRKYIESKINPERNVFAFPSNRSLPSIQKFKSSRKITPMQIFAYRVTDGIPAIKVFQSGLLYEDLATIALIDEKKIQTISVRRKTPRVSKQKTPSICRGNINPSNYSEHELKQIFSNIDICISKKILSDDDKIFYNGGYNSLNQKDWLLHYDTLKKYREITNGPTHIRKKRRLRK